MGAGLKKAKELGLGQSGIANIVLTNRKSFSMSFEEYLSSSLFVDNWMTRQLCGKETQKLTPKDYTMAQNILKHKFKIGLMNDLTASFQKFQKHFNWELNTETKKCVSNLLIQNTPQQVPRSKKVMNAVVLSNKYDMQLYAYARVLYQS